MRHQFSFPGKNHKDEIASSFGFVSSRKTVHSCVHLISNGQTTQHFFTIVIKVT